MRLAALALLLAMPAGAAPILDQEALPLAGAFNVDNDTNTSQRLWIAKTGWLTQIDVFITEDVGTCAAQPGSCALVLQDSRMAPTFQITVDLAASSTLQNVWVSFVLPVPIAVSVGDVLYFDLDNGDLVVVGASQYGAGLLWTCHSDGCLDPFSPRTPGFARMVPAGATFDPLGVDYALRSWVEAVPEPAIALLLCAAAGLAYRSRSIGPGSLGSTRTPPSAVSAPPETSGE